MSSPYLDRANIISRYKERKQGRTMVLFGRDTEADANSRSNARQMFDGDMLVHGDMLVRCLRTDTNDALRLIWQECALDLTFSTLGIDTPKIEHPIVMTERLANPLFTRASTSSCHHLSW